MSFSLWIVAASDPGAVQYRAGYFAQLALLPFLQDIKDFELSIGFGPGLSIDNLDRDIALETAVIRAICAATSHVKLTVAISDQHQTI